MVMLVNVVDTIVKKLTDQPGKVTIEHRDTGEKAVIDVRVASQDLSRLIGKEGRTFKALRTLVMILSSGHVDLVVDAAHE